MPFMDPAFAAAVCRYDLTGGSIKLIAPVSQAYTSVTFYTRNSVAYYAINDRAAGRRSIELDLMTPAQHAQVPEEEDVTAADRLIIESPSTRGLVVVRALAPEPGLMSDGAGRAGAGDLQHSAGAVTYCEIFRVASGAAAMRGATTTTGFASMRCCSSVTARSASAAIGSGSAAARCSTVKR